MPSVARLWVGQGSPAGGGAPEVAAGLAGPRSPSIPRPGEPGELPRGPEGTSVTSSRDLRSTHKESEAQARGLLGLRRRDAGCGMTVSRCPPGSPRSGAWKMRKRPPGSGAVGRGTASCGPRTRTGAAGPPSCPSRRPCKLLARPGPVPPGGGVCWQSGPGRGAPEQGRPRRSSAQPQRQGWAEFSGWGSPQPPAPAEPAG